MGAFFANSKKTQARLDIPDCARRFLLVHNKLQAAVIDFGSHIQMQTLR